jgi:hypothetical protein
MLNSCSCFLLRGKEAVMTKLDLFVTGRSEVLNPDQDPTFKKFQVQIRIRPLNGILKHDGTL